MDAQKQDQFNATLFEYLWIFSLTAIITGSIINFYLTRKLVRPLRELIKSTKRMRQGHYPKPIKVTSRDETGQLIGHFNELVQQLKINQQYKQKLVSDLSHEFRTPLSNLNGYLSALKNGVIAGDPKLFHSLYEESNRLTTMVQQLEQLKEWDYVSKQSFAEKEYVDMALLIEQSVEMFRWSLNKTGITVEMQVERGIANVNNGGITQVVSNLIENAIRYYQGSGPISIKGECKDTVYKVSVIGQGQAIPETEQENIFERFYRTDTSRNRKTGGSGLGLAISREIVKHHNGRIGINSTGYYHTFWFTLPFRRNK
ncbi:ATP-binding protein [Aquibacillus sp. 3ASR75-11]|uniref:histidine kinase n=1 Tax=Terrihalobacillus insolitus TaxID=2950438 RepID=A0A9X3WT35_9BACI|nr:ATP-binding protein [Terrihalobacillus insolitus]MDC3424348.1 ATP-binding protein [Terrihalobacillus insolitus]